MNTPNTAGKSYAQAATIGPTIPPPLNPMQPWRYFLDHDPWAFQKSLPQNQTTPIPNHHPTLTQPPNPNTEQWKGRCYNCLEIGHDQKECPSAERVCAKCWLKGHQARDCKNATLANRNQFDPLQPRENLGESRMPTNRPKLATVFIPETRQMYLESLDLNRAMVIDARLRPTHTDQTVQSVMMVACRTNIPFTYHTHGRATIPALTPTRSRSPSLSTSTHRPAQSNGVYPIPLESGDQRLPDATKIQCMVAAEQTLATGVELGPLNTSSQHIWHSARPLTYLQCKFTRKNLYCGSSS